MAEIHRCNQAPDEILVLDEQQRTGVEAPHHQPAEQDRRGAGAGNAEREHRQQRRGAGSMRRSLRREHALDTTLAKALRVLGKALGEVVTHEGSGNGASRGDAEPATDEGGAQQRHPVLRQVFSDDSTTRKEMPAAWPRSARRSSMVRISLMPNRPMTATRKFMPRKRSVEPKVMRSWPDTVSMPTAGEQHSERHRNDCLVLGFAAEAEAEADKEQKVSRYTEK